MKKLQLYRIITTNEYNNNTRHVVENENPSMSDTDYYSIYSDNADITLVNQEDHTLMTNNKKIYHANTNLNEYHKMIQAHKFSQTEKMNNKTYINSIIKMNDNFITIQLNTKEKLSLE